MQEKSEFLISQNLIIIIFFTYPKFLESGIRQTFKSNSTQKNLKRKLSVG